MLGIFVKVCFCSDKKGLNLYSLFYVQKVQSMVNISHNIWKLFNIPHPDFLTNNLCSHAHAYVAIWR
jgi:hypothetical protein